MNTLIKSVEAEYRRYKAMAEGAFAQVPRLTAPFSVANADMTVKMVVPTFGSLVSICMSAFLVWTAKSRAAMRIGLSRGGSSTGSPTSCRGR